MRKMASIYRNVRTFCTWGAIGDRWVVPEFTLNTIGRIGDAILRNTALGSKFECLVWSLLPCFSAEPKKMETPRGIASTKCTLGGHLPWLGGFRHRLRLH